LKQRRSGIFFASTHNVILGGRRDRGEHRV
jgi:hypothetical protein